MTKKISIETYIGLTIVAGLLFFLFAASPGGSLRDAFAAVSTSTQQTINLTVNQTITLTLSTTTLTLPALTPGAPVSATSSATVVTNSDGGWQLEVKRDSSTSTLAYGATSTFPDATSWNPTGSGNATTTDLVGANLHFKVATSGTTAALYSSTYWGPNDNDGASNAKYAGHATSSQKVASRTDYAAGNQVVVLKVRANSPADQRSGAYTGTITITAITLP